MGILKAAASSSHGLSRVAYNGEVNYYKDRSILLSKWYILEIFTDVSRNSPQEVSGITPLVCG
jgi:hypothetical protein